MARAPLFDEHLIAGNRRKASLARVPGADFLLGVVADEMCERLSAIQRTFPVVAELHGYNGLVLERVAAAAGAQHRIRVEADPALLEGAEEAHVASLETVPLAAASVDLVLSPLSLHLTNDTPGVFVQIARVLQPDGLFLGAMPGAGTLRELREALLSAESEILGSASARIVPFADVRDAGALLQRAGFALPVTDIESYTVRYDDMFALIRDLRAMGMQNPLAERSRRPVPRGVFLRAAEIYAERFSDADGRVRATFVIVYLSGWRPHESQQKPLRPGSAKVSLAHALEQAKGRAGR